MRFNVNRILLLLGLMLFGCSSKAPGQQTIVVPPAPSNAPTIIQTETPLPTAPSVDTERENILSQIKQLANNYNSQVDQYKQNEKATIIVDPDTGQEKLELSSNAIEALTPLYDNVYEQIGSLSEKYWELYQKDHPTDPLPISMSKDELTQYKQKLVNEFNTWEANELKTGAVIKLYNPEDMVFYRILVGDSYGADRWKWSYITRIIALSNAPSEELMNLDIQKIHQFDGGAVSLAAVSAYPFYRTDIKLTRYETEKANYLLYTDFHEFIEVIPKEVHPTDQEGSLVDLEAKAVETVHLFSPNTKLEELTLIQHEKAGNYFFRWEDRTKPLLDDGQTYPFVLVALNSKGELLNYYNTLSLAR